MNKRYYLILLMLIPLTSQARPLLLGEDQTARQALHAMYQARNTEQCYIMTARHTARRSCIFSKSYSTDTEFNTCVGNRFSALQADRIQHTKISSKSKTL